MREGTRLKCDACNKWSPVNKNWYGCSDAGCD